MKKICYILSALVAILGCVFTSCSDEETNMSRAVIASVDVLEYEVSPTGPQLITVTSDADWIAECPEWVTISPTSGHAGRTEVEISVSNNVREGATDNPRKGNVLFKGRNLASNAIVIVRQAGDKFRDPIDFTIETALAADDETIVKIPSLTVLSITGSGFVATDGNTNVYVADVPFAVTVGQKLTVVGEKLTSDMKIPYIEGGKMTDEGTGTVSGSQPLDVTGNLDKIEASNYQLITLTGTYDAIMKCVGIRGMANSAYIYDYKDMNSLEELGGHKLTVTGYFAGTATPVVRIIPSEIIDHGYNETVYFFDDFEWMDPWTTIAGVHDYVKESDKVKAESKNIAGVNADGKKLIDELYDRGYNFVKATFDGKEDRPFETRIYMQKNYLKFGLTGIEAGLVLPSLKNIPAGEALQLCFNWSPMRQGDPGKDGRAYDAINLIVIVDNNGSEVKIPVPAHTLKKGDNHDWMNAVIDLSDQDINENTKITIRSADDKWPTDKVNRWFIDNIKVRQAL